MALPFATDIVTTRPHKLEGQTDAGQRAERDIAEAVVDGVLRCCRDKKWIPKDTTGKEGNVMLYLSIERLLGFRHRLI
jgi:hypothetical protein